MLRVDVSCPYFNFHYINSQCYIQHRHFLSSLITAYFKTATYDKVYCFQKIIIFILEKSLINRKSFFFCFCLTVINDYLKIKHRVKTLMLHFLVYNSKICFAFNTITCLKDLKLDRMLRS